MRLSIAYRADLGLAPLALSDIVTNVLGLDPFSAVDFRTVDAVGGGVLDVLFVPELLGLI